MAVFFFMSPPSQTVQSDSDTADHWAGFDGRLLLHVTSPPTRSRSQVRYEPLHTGPALMAVFFFISPPRGKEAAPPHAPIQAGSHLAALCAPIQFAAGLRVRDDQ